ncbi:hypothetical protein D1007_62281 [Hordeum vulgare]|nr:hypothetical protein D1007_62281 [Hordeum vulgare]
MARPDPPSFDRRRQSPLLLAPAALTPNRRRPAADSPNRPPAAVFTPAAIHLSHGSTLAPPPRDRRQLIPSAPCAHGRHRRPRSTPPRCPCCLRPGRRCGRRDPPPLAGIRQDGPLRHAGPELPHGARGAVEAAAALVIGTDLFKRRRRETRDHACTAVGCSQKA